MKKEQKYCSEHPGRKAKYWCDCGGLWCEECADGGYECPEDYEQHGLRKI